MPKQLKDISYIFKNLNSKRLTVILISFQFWDRKDEGKRQTFGWFLMEYASFLFLKPHILQLNYKNF